MTGATPPRPDLDEIERMLNSDDGWEYEHGRMVAELLTYTRDLERLAQAVCAAKWESEEQAVAFEALRAVLTKREGEG